MSKILSVTIEKTHLYVLSALALLATVVAHLAASNCFVFIYEEPKVPPSLVDKD